MTCAPPGMNTIEHFVLYLQPDVQGILRPSGTGHGQVRDAFVLAVQVDAF